ncbi:MAG: imidazole glycerol phosphate synthase subunit HisH [Bradymonadaceae bacterium]|nr:imidazole glycerol phosphate synthase subunit HisH [Lujinxingiaceae bacterium]
MSAAEVVIARTGVANIASVVAAFERLGAAVRLVDTPEAIKDAEFVVFPGVGSFGAGMHNLRESGLADALFTRIHEERATLAICLGQQLLFEESDESPGIRGLGLLPGRVTRFPNAVRVPQFGWNAVEPGEGCRFLEPGYAYFANSYRVTQLVHGWSGAFSDHGGPFVAAMERGPVLTCQFHPELSGAWGHRLLERWLKG